MDVAKIKTLIDIMTYGITTSTQYKNDWDYWVDATNAEACTERCDRKGLGLCIMKFKQI